MGVPSATLLKHPSQSETMQKNAVSSEGLCPMPLSLKQEALTPKHTVRVRVKQRIKAAKNFSRALCQGKCFCKTDESTVTLS